MKTGRLRSCVSVLLALLLFAQCLPLGLIASAVEEALPRTAEMPSTLSGLEEYRHAGVALSDDGYIGIPVNLHAYYDTALTYEGGTAGTPLVMYVLNTNTERVGTDSDHTIVADLLARGVFVVVVDYLSNPLAVSPGLDQSLQLLRTDIMTEGKYTDGVYAKCTDPKRVYAENTTTKAYILPAGYNILLDEVYWSYDEHGAVGTMDRIVEIWNNDFASVHRDKIITFQDRVITLRDKAGNILYEADGVTPKTTSTPTVEQYTDSFTDENPMTIWDCVGPDGKFMSLDLCMDVIYPTNPQNEVPVMVCLSSGETRVLSWTRPKNAHLTGFLFDGYAGVVSDFSFAPMAFDVNYGDFSGASKTYSVSGDGGSYALHGYNGMKVDTALLRTLRLMADPTVSNPESRTYKFNVDKIGIYGISKSGICTRMAHPNPETLEERRFFNGHVGETRYEALYDSAYAGIYESVGGYVDPYMSDTVNNNDGNGNPLIRDPKPQPALTYSDGTPIRSGADFVYSSVGGGQDALVPGSAPIYGTGTAQAGGSYQEFYRHTRTACRVANIPFVGLACLDLGHEYGNGKDSFFGTDVYDTFRIYANYWLKDEAAELVYISVGDNYEQGESEDIVLQFTGPIPAYEITKVKVVNDLTGQEALGTWSGGYGNLIWEFTPHTLVGGVSYTVVVPGSMKDENGNFVCSSLTSMTKRFTTAVEQRVEASKVAGNALVGTEDALYAVFSENTAYQSSPTIDLRFGVNNNAANRVVVYGTAALNDTDYAASPWEKLGEVPVNGAGDYNFDVTEYVKSCAAAPAFRLVTLRPDGEVLLNAFRFDKETPGAVTSTSTADGARLYYTGNSYATIEEDPTEGAPAGNRVVKYHYFVRTSTYINVDNELDGNYVENLSRFSSTEKCLPTLTADHAGTRFRVSFRIYDTTSRIIRVTVGANSKGDVLDWNGNQYSFETKAGQWCTYTFEFDIDDPMYWEDFQKNALVFSAPARSAVSLDEFAAVNPQGYAKGDYGSAKDNSLFAGTQGLTSAYTKYNHVKDAVADGKVTVAEGYQFPFYMDDLSFCSVSENVSVVTETSEAGVAPSLILHNASFTTTLPVDATYVSPSGAVSGGDLSVSGGTAALNKSGINTYVKLSLDGYGGEDAFFCFTTAEGHVGTMQVYGVADAAAAASWDPKTVNAMNAPASARGGNGVDLAAVYGRCALAVLSVAPTSVYTVDITSYARAMKEKGASALTLILSADAVAGGAEVTNSRTYDESNIKTKGNLDFYIGIRNAGDDGRTMYDLYRDDAGNQSLLYLPNNRFRTDTMLYLLCLPDGSYRYNEFKNTNWTAADVGKTYRVTLRIKADTVGYVDFGIMCNPGDGTLSREKTANLAAGVTPDSVDYSTVMYDKATVRATFDADSLHVWQSVTFDFTVDETMLPKEMSNGSLSSLNLLGLKGTGYDIKGATSDGEGPAQLWIDDISVTTVPAEAEGVSVDAVANSIGLRDYNNLDDFSTVSAGLNALGNITNGYNVTRPKNETDIPTSNVVIGMDGTDPCIEIFPSYRTQSYMTLYLFPFSKDPAYAKNYTFWQNVHFDASDLGKTYRITFRAKANAVGHFEYGMMAPFYSSSKTPYQRADSYHQKPYENAKATATFTADMLNTWQTFTLEFTVDETMLPITYEQADHGSLSTFGLRFEDGGYNKGETTQATSILIDDIASFEVKNPDFAITVNEKLPNTLMKERTFDETALTNTNLNDWVNIRNGNRCFALNTEESNRVLEYRPWGRGSSAGALNLFCVAGTSNDNRSRWNSDTYGSNWTAADVGQTYLVTFRVKSTVEGSFRYGMLCNPSGGSLKRSKQEDLSTETDEHGNLLYVKDPEGKEWTQYPYDHATATATFTQKDLNTWQTYSLMFTVDETMLPLVMNNGTKSSINLFGIYADGYGYTTPAEYTTEAVISFDDIKVYKMPGNTSAAAEKTADFEDQKKLSSSAGWVEFRALPDPTSPTGYTASALPCDWVRTVRAGDVDTNFGVTVGPEDIHSGEVAMQLHSSNHTNAFRIQTPMMTHTAADLGKQYTVSFFMKADRTGTFVVGLSGTAGNTAYYHEVYGQCPAQPMTFTVAEAGVWTRYTYTYTVEQAQYDSAAATAAYGNASVLSHLGIFPYGMGQFNQGDLYVEGSTTIKRLGEFRPVTMYFDDFCVREVVEVQNSTLALSGSAGVCPDATSTSVLGVDRGSAPARTEEKKAYLTFAQLDAATAVVTTLRIPLSGAAGQRVFVYALTNADVVGPLSWVNAPAYTLAGSVDSRYIYGGAPLFDGVVSTDMLEVDVTDYIKACSGKAPIFAVTVEDTCRELYYMPFRTATATAGLDYTALGAAVAQMGEEGLRLSSVQTADGIRIENIFGCGAQSGGAADYEVTLQLTNNAATAAALSLGFDGAAQRAVSLLAGETKTLTLRLSSAQSKSLLITGAAELTLHSLSVSPAPLTIVNDGQTSAALVVAVADGSVEYVKDFGAYANLTLHSDFVYNAYVPVSDEVEAITLDGVRYEDLLALPTREHLGNLYYVVSRRVYAKDGADSFYLTVSLKKTGIKERVARYTLSIPRYADILLGSETVSATEKDLLLDTLSYIRNAAVYFYGAGSAESERTNAAVANHLAGYTETVPENLVNGTPKVEDPEDILAGATLDVGARPAFLFYVQKGKEDFTFTFTAAGKRLAARRIVSEDGTVAILVDTFAYHMIYDIEVTAVKGDESHHASYNLCAYYDFLLGSAEVGDRAGLKALVEALYRYTESADALKKEQA